MKRQFTACVAVLACVLSAGVSRAQCVDEGAWDSLTPIPVPTAQAVSVVVDGKVYLIGNKNNSPDNNRTWCFDPKTNSWAELAPMPTGRGMAAAAAVDGVIHVFGGNNDFSNNWLSTHEAFDTRTNTWTSNLPPLPHEKPRGLLSAVAVGHRIYVMGGMNSYDVPTYSYNCIWDCDTDSWAPDGAALPTPRAEHAAAALDGKIYLFGGNYRLVHFQNRVVAGVDVYDTQSGTWSYGGTLPILRREHAVVEQCGKFYVIGGNELLPDGQEGVPLRSVLEFDPALDCWSVVTPLPVPLYRHTAATLSGQILIFGGSLGGTVAPIADAWSGTPKRMIGDLDGDGEVGLTDLANMLANFGRRWSRS